MSKILSAEEFLDKAIDDVGFGRASVDSLTDRLRARDKAIMELEFEWLEACVAISGLKQGAKDCFLAAIRTKKEDVLRELL